MRTVIAVLAATFLAGGVAAAAELRSDTLAGFREYVSRAEARIAREQSSPEAFLSINSLPPQERAEAERRLRSGEVMIRTNGGGQASHGLVHDWTGIAFISGATVLQVLERVQDYDHLPRYYSPEVMRSRLLVRSGDDFRMTLRLREHKVVTVVLDSEYEVHYGRLDEKHWYSQSRSTRVNEIADAGSPQERVQTAGDEHGFLWRLNSYWRFVQAPDGVYIQCEAISLTRDIPTGLGWLVRPFVQSIPRESLQFTLTATRKAVGSSSPAPPTARSQHDQQ